MAMMQNSWLNKTYRETLPADSVHERRGQQRMPCATPAIVTSGQHTLAASMKNIGTRGLFFITDAFFGAGCDIAILLVLPEGLGLPLTGMVCCHGRVVRVSSCFGQYGIAAEIERMTPGDILLMARQVAPSHRTRRGRRVARNTRLDLPDFEVAYRVHA